MRNYLYLINGHFACIVPTFRDARRLYRESRSDPIRSFVRRPIYD